MTEVFRERDPFPQALPGKKGQGWKIADSGHQGGSCVPSKKELFVPLGGECDKCGADHNYGVRRHEMGHAKWTPARAHLLVEKAEKLNPGTMDNDCVQVCEDLRLGLLLQDAGVESQPHLCPEDKDKMLVAYKTWDLPKRIRWIVAGRTYADDAPLQYSIMVEGARDGEDPTLPWDIANQVLNTMRYRPDKTGRTVTIDRPTFDDMLRAAKYLKELLDIITPAQEAAYQKAMRNKAKAAQREREAEEARRKAEAEAARAEKEGAAKKQEGKAAKDAIDKEVNKKYDGSAGGKGTSAGGRGRNGTIWGDMETLYPPLPELLPGRLQSRNTSSQEGDTIRSVHRLLLDGKIFNRRTKKPGGAVLLDGSGSMPWTSDDIWNIMKHCPGAIIGIYNGSTHGELKIIAKDGRHATTKEIAERKYGGNAVDGPALAWLLEQDGPKVWISDGHVIAPYGNQNQAFFERDLYVTLGKVKWVCPNATAPMIGGKKAENLCAALDTGLGEGCTKATVHLLKTGGALYFAA